MGFDMITAFLIGAGALWLLSRKNKNISGIGAARRNTKKYYVYAGYYENYVSSEPMPAPYVLRRTFRDIDSAIEYAESFDDYVVYCDNVKYDLPDYIYDAYFGVSGIGAVRRSKRRIWSEVEQAQKHGIDLTDPDAWKNHTDTLSWMAQGKIKEGASDKPIEQRYFNQLQRAYKSIAGTNLPYTENVVRNENDDVILIYRDYQLDKLPAKAAEYMYDQAIENMHNDPETSAYWATIAMIADGQLKFVWSSTKDNVHRGAEKLVFGKSAPVERKRRISYLASPAKGGRYPEEYAHQLWERTGADTDDQSITNGVLAAIRDIDTKGSAAEYCKREYLQAFQVEEPLLYQDVPF